MTEVKTERKKPNNLRTGLILGVLAAFFFLSVFAKRLWLS
ncbi:cytochrome oxidase small assembly protein [Janthinobacterium sp. SUN120]|nr:cytochrome oxidase small assembly protein [Janthinobacterium sp. SUN120]MDN2718467.1 cytochrome oxidase small assembly protein [Janthinobacterium sp. SUN120]